MKVKADGTVKVLDFGLAKAMDPVGDASSVSMSPTLSMAATQQGVILGTAAYMSPEQARGKSVDKRADIWAFGAVLYEMLTGTMPFPGDDVSQTLARVIDRDPDWDTLPSVISPTLAVFLRQCLEKDSKRRLGDIRDMRLALEGAFETAAPLATGAMTLVQPVWRRAAPLATALLIGGLVAGLIVWNFVPSVPPGPRPGEFAIVPPGNAGVGIDNNSPDIAISPDGRYIVYATGAGNVYQWYVRAVDELIPTPLEDLAATVENPFISADSAWIGFDDQSDNTIKRVSILRRTGGFCL